MDFPMPIFILIFVYLASSIKILKEYERGVIYRLGRILKKAKGPGIIFVFAPFDKMAITFFALIFTGTIWPNGPLYALPTMHSGKKGAVVVLYTR